MDAVRAAPPFSAATNVMPASDVWTVSHAGMSSCDTAHADDAPTATDAPPPSPGISTADGETVMVSAGRGACESVMMTVSPSSLVMSIDTVRRSSVSLAVAVRTRVDVPAGPLAADAFSHGVRAERSSDHADVERTVNVRDSPAGRNDTDCGEGVMRR